MKTVSITNKSYNRLKDVQTKPRFPEIKVYSKIYLWDKQKIEVTVYFNLEIVWHEFTINYTIMGKVL